MRNKINRNPQTIEECTENQLRALNCYQEACKKAGRPLRHKELEDYHLKWTSAYITVSALMGFSAEKLGFEIPDTRHAKTKEELLEEYIRWVKVAKIFFISPAEFKKRGLPSHEQYISKFGSIDELIRQAKAKTGLDLPIQRPIRNAFSDEEIKEQLVVLANKLGRIPTNNEISISKNLPNISTVRRQLNGSIDEIFEDLKDKLTFEINQSPKNQGFLFNKDTV